MFLLEFMQEIGGFTVVYGLRKEDTIITENKGSKGATPSINFPNSTMRFLKCCFVWDKSHFRMVGGFEIYVYSLCFLTARYTIITFQRL